MQELHEQNDKNENSEETPRYIVALTSRQSGAIYTYDSFREKEKAEEYQTILIERFPKYNVLLIDGDIFDQMMLENDNKLLADVRYKDKHRGNKQKEQSHKRFERLSAWIDRKINTLLIWAYICILVITGAIILPEFGIFIKKDDPVKIVKSEIPETKEHDIIVITKWIKN